MSSQIFKEIQPNKILHEVIRAVTKAKNKIQMTMLLNEELNAPIRKEYFDLLNEKSRNGITIERICFGSCDEFNKFKSINYFHNSNYYNYLANEKYLRMILIDDSDLFFKINDIFINTQNEDLIFLYSNYFNSVCLKLTKS
jgi:hypothetical protein